MGAPTGGTLKIVCGGEEKQIGDWVAASFVWSTDSRYLAFAEWTRSRMQTLCVYRVADGVILRNPEEFRVLELHEFESGTIKCVDSPVYMKRTLSIKFNDCD